MGYLLPKLGINYHFEGLVNLYNMIKDNGYEFVYLTARSMNEMPTSRNYLESITDETNLNMHLPKGPILMFPNSRIDTLKNEIIYKTSDIFKTKIMRLCQNIFLNNRGGLISGYGNSKTDIIAYTNVGMSQRLIWLVKNSKLYQ
jgi:phosphatidate phosphatase LPIN